MTQDARRVVIGINVFDMSIGEKVAAAPVHSDAYRAAMARLQRFTRTSDDVSLASPATMIVPVSNDSQAICCARCNSTIPVTRTPVQFKELSFCGVRCLKDHRKKQVSV